MRKHIMIITFCLINLIGLLIIYFFILHKELLETNYEKYILILPIVVIMLWPMSSYTYYRVITNSDEARMNGFRKFMLYGDYFSMPLVFIFSPLYSYDYIKYFIIDFKKYRYEKNYK